MRRRPFVRTGPLGRRLRDFAQDVYRLVLLLALVVRWGTEPLLRRLLHFGPSPISTGDRLRRVIERMGVTYVKLGQFLAQRYDVLPPEICAELDRLFENAVELPLAVVRKQLDAELGAPLDALFASFEARPIAAASVSQVHRARTRDGELVAVKVQRPGIEEVLSSDVRMLKRGARIVDRLRLFGDVAAVKLVDEFATFTVQELDFRAEGATADAVRRDSIGLGIRIPRIRRDLTTRRVLTMEFVDGVSALWVCQAAETEGLHVLLERLPGIDLVAFVETLGHACLNHMFVSGLFHGDPHPGNVLVSRAGTPVLLDFGIFGRLDPGIRAQLGRFFELLSNGSIQEAVRCYLQICPPSDDTDLYAYRNELAVSLREWYAITRTDRGPISERHPFRFVGDIVGAMRRNAVPMPSDQLLFWRALTSLGSFALRWPARFDLTDTLRRFFAEYRAPAWQQAVELLQGVSPASVVQTAQAGPRPIVGLLRSTSDQPHMAWRVRKAVGDRRRERQAMAALVLVLLATATAVAAAVGLRAESTVVVLAPLSMAMLGLTVWRVRD